VALHTEGRAVGDVRARGRRAYDLGPASERPYLDHALLERALTQTRADAAWVGWGFVAEDAAFADLCARDRGGVHRSER
jgi:biotin carboxylase